MSLFLAVIARDVSAWGARTHGRLFSFSFPTLSSSRAFPFLGISRAVVGFDLMTGFFIRPFSFAFVLTL
jgi:hypothetical protein